MSLISQLSSAPLVLSKAEFMLSGPRHVLAAQGQRLGLPVGDLDSLASRAAQFFRDHRHGPRRLVGAVPYLRGAMDALYQPEMLGVPAPIKVPERPQKVQAKITPQPTPADYCRAVALALEQIRSGIYDKIVLSRSLHLALARPAHLPSLLAQLRRDAQITTFATPLPQGALIGATPELLIEKTGQGVMSHPLAGSARRSADPVADQAAAEALLRSDKDLREHAMAAEMVLDTLAPYCATLGRPEGLALHKTAQMWHLGTQIDGQLKDADTPCAQLLAALHPTPAVCGLPARPAAAALPALEGYDRGFYAGAVGWLQENGDGCWYLSLRCAEIAGNQARLYAGAGVVAGSDPQAERAETTAKFLAMLAAFGLSDDDLCE